MVSCNPYITYKDILDVPIGLQEQVLIWRNYDHVRENAISPEKISEKQHREWISMLHQNKNRQKVRVAFYEESPYGILSLKNIDRQSLRCDWGMYIGDIGYLGRGLGRCMLYDLLVWVFDEEKLERLYTSVVADNTKVVALYLDFGFHFEGRFERHIRRDTGVLVDVYWMALFAHEWRRKKGD